MTQTFKYTYLEQVPVRYSGSVPSMSRRGGVRVHPIADGGIDMERQAAMPKWRDSLGHNFREHEAPKTGFVTSVSSVVGSAQSKHGVSGGATGSLKYLASKVVETGLDRVYLDESGRVIRTTDMGERPVIARPKNAGGSVPPKTQKRGRNVSPNPRKSARPTTPGGTGPAGRITDADVEAFVRAVAKKHGQTITVITPSMMRDGREMLKNARRLAEKALSKNAGR